MRGARSASPGRLVVAALGATMAAGGCGQTRSANDPDPPDADRADAAAPDAAGPPCEAVCFEWLPDPYRSHEDSFEIRFQCHPDGWNPCPAGYRCGIVPEEPDDRPWAYEACVPEHGATTGLRGSFDWNPYRAGPPDGLEVALRFVLANGETFPEPYPTVVLEPLEGDSDGPYLVTGDDTEGGIYRFRVPPATYGLKAFYHQAGVGLPRFGRLEVARAGEATMPLDARPVRFLVAFDENPPVPRIPAAVALELAFASRGPQFDRVAPRDWDSGPVADTRLVKIGTHRARLVSELRNNVGTNNRDWLSDFPLGEPPPVSFEVPPGREEAVVTLRFETTELIARLDVDEPDPDARFGGAWWRLSPGMRGHGAYASSTPELRLRVFPGTYRGRASGGMVGTARPPFPLTTERRPNVVSVTRSVSTGTVTLDGAPAPERLEVAFRPAGTAGRWRRLADEDGRVEVNVHAGGTYDVYVASSRDDLQGDVMVAESWSPAEEPLPELAVTSREVVLEVTDPTSSPAAERWIELRRPEERPSAYSIGPPAGPALAAGTRSTVRFRALVGTHGLWLRGRDDRWPSLEGDATSLSLGRLEVPPGDETVRLARAIPRRFVAVEVQDGGATPRCPGYELEAPEGYFLVRSLSFHRSFRIVDGRAEGAIPPGLVDEGSWLCAEEDRTYQRPLFWRIAVP